MTSCDEQDFLVVSALGEVETAGTLSVGCGLGSNEEPKRGSKRTANIDGRMYVGNGFEEAWTGRLDVDGLPALDVDVVDSELEKGQAAVHRVVGVLAEESLGSDTNLKHDGTDDLPVSDLDKANDVYGRPQHPRQIQEVAGLRTQILPDGAELGLFVWEATGKFWSKGRVQNLSGRDRSGA